MTKGPAFLRALPPYIGAKRRLCPFIFGQMAEVLPRSAWRGARLIDPMSGSGSVALHAKALGFHVIAADAAERAVVVGRALIANATVRLAHADLLLATSREPKQDNRSALLATILPPDLARTASSLLCAADEHREPKTSLIQLFAIKLVLRCMPMSLPRARDAHQAALGDFDDITARRTLQYLSAAKLRHPQALLKLAADVNAGVFSGFGEASQGDAREILARTAADVAYLDPPYKGTSSYLREYGVLDRILGDGPSPSSPPTLDELLEAARHVPIVVLSYGGPRVTLDGLHRVVGRHRRVVNAISVHYPHLHPLSKEVRRATNQEHLVVAVR